MPVMRYTHYAGEWFKGKALIIAHVCLSLSSSSSSVRPLPSWYQYLILTSNIEPYTLAAGCQSLTATGQRRGAVFDLTLSRQW